MKKIYLLFILFFGITLFSRTQPINLYTNTFVNASGLSITKTISVNNKSNPNDWRVVNNKLILSEGVNNNSYKREPNAIMTNIVRFSPVNIYGIDTISLNFDLNQNLRPTDTLIVNHYVDNVLIKSYRYRGNINSTINNKFGIISSSVLYRLEFVMKITSFQGDNGVTTGTLNVDNLFMFGTINADPLPIDLNSFEVEKINGNALIKFTTLSEVNNDYFIIEKSIDLINWNFVDRIEGAGNSNEKITYDVVDYSPYIGLSYYKLTQYDFNGDSKSYVTTLKNNKDNSVYPNPCYDVLYTPYGKYTIFDMNGQVIEKGISNGKLPLNLNPGIYIIEINDDKFKIIKY